MNLFFPFESTVTTGDVNTLAIAYLIACAVGFLVWIGCIVASIIIMKRKGRSAGLGFVFGFFLSCIGLIIVLCKKPVNK